MMTRSTSGNCGSRLFASDNAAGIHPAVLEAIRAANTGHALAYGEDRWTARATASMHEHFGADIEFVFTFGGTGANMVGLATVVDSFENVICPDSSHLWADEGGGPQRWLGVRVTPVSTANGKLRPRDIEPFLGDRGQLHRAQPRVVSISQPTEWGTVYSIGELSALGDFCRAHDLYLHVDGARFSNAAAALGVGLRELSADCGIDVLSFGGTKNGLLAGEAVIAFARACDRGLVYRLKQCAQLGSKLRFIAAQFEALLCDGLWLRNASHANRMAGLLRQQLDGIPGVELAQPVQSNAVFVRLPEARAGALGERFGVKPWLRDKNVFRIMASFDTTEADVHALVDAVRNA